MSETRAEQAKALRAAAERIELGARLGMESSRRRPKDSKSAKARRSAEGHRNAAGLSIAGWLRREADAIEATGVGQEVSGNPARPHRARLYEGIA